jgi:hypothetical protein
MEDFSLFYLYYPGLHLLGGISLSLKKLLLKFSSYHLKYRYTSSSPSAELSIHLCPRSSSSYFVATRDRFGKHIDEQRCVLYSNPMNILLL